eukprot:TRINITY_DN24626_c0_g1_i1.p1 TRINITY_DN24626_c0_g1~~TRINITY_DN24626_c0_g1_i1.p1  ORF type:complete len:542 (+),score=115.91 TRINITY_DN24626_c0_g1_i1:78-1703(+)
MEQFETHTSQDFNEPYNEIAQAIVHDLSSLKALRANAWVSSTQRSFASSGRLLLTSGARTFSSCASRSCTDLFRSDDGSRRFRGTAMASTAKTIWAASRSSFGDQESGSAQLLMMSRTWHATASRSEEECCEPQPRSQATVAEVENADSDSEGAARVRPGQAMGPSSCSSAAEGSQGSRPHDAEEELQDATQDESPELELPAKVKKRPKYAPPWVRHRQGWDSDAAPELAGHELDDGPEGDRTEAQPAQPSTSVPQDVLPACDDQNEASRQSASEALTAGHAQGSLCKPPLPKTLPAQDTPSGPSGQADLLVISSVTHAASLKASWVMSPETSTSDGVDASRHWEQTDGVASLVTGHAANAMPKESMPEQEGRGSQVLETHKPPSSQVSNASLAPCDHSALGLLDSAGRFSRKVGASMGACAAPARKKKRKVRKLAAQEVRHRSLDTRPQNRSSRPCLPPIVVVEHHHVHRHQHRHHTEVVENEEEVAALCAQHEAASQAKAKLAKSVSLPSLFPAGLAGSAGRLQLQGKSSSLSMAELMS